MATPSISKVFKKKDKEILPEAESPAEPSANKSVQKELDVLVTGSRKRKRGEYGDYSPDTRYKIARYAIENGNSRAARHFSSVLDRNINESTVRGFKTSYNRRRNLNKEFEPSQTSSLPRSPRGRPTKLGKYDEFVQSYIRKLRQTGGIVNSRIIISAAEGFLIAEDRTLLSENGGPITLTKAWAVSLMKRMGLVKRKGTKGVKHLPHDFESIKSEYLKRIDSVVKDHNIPDSLIINWDQTGSNYVPVNPWTMAEKGSEQVPIAQLDDKRQMTVLLACTKSGEMLPPQLIYQGKTDLCHPTYPFPESWDITHTDSHWSTSESMIRFVEKEILPYIDGVKDEHDLPLRQHSLCIFDVFKAHQKEELRDLLRKKNIHMVYVPVSCTDRLQPLDLSVNASFKLNMKNCFEDWYSGEVAEQLKLKSPEDVEISMSLSTVKPLHARWLVSVFQKLERDKDLIKRGFSDAGIV